MNNRFDQLPDRRSTESVKWRVDDEDVLPMWVADMDFRSPEPVIEALQKRVAHGVFGYPDEPRDLRDAVVDWVAERHGWKISADWLVFVPGVVTGLNLAAHAFVDKGEAVLIQPPVYMPFLTVPRNAGVFRQDALLAPRADGYYEVDFNAFENAINAQSRLFMFCNPHNPVGRVFSRPELEQMAEICLRNRMIICSDEIHADLVFSDSKHIPIASLSPEIAQRSVTLIAPSKTFNLAGLGCSVAIIPDPELRKQFMHGGEGLVHGVNLLGLVAAQVAYREGKEWLDDLLVYLQGNRDWMVEFINCEMPGVKIVKPEGTYLAWLDCRRANLPKELHPFFLEHARVNITEGSAFGKGGEGFLRMNFGCPRPMLVEALGRMRKALIDR